MNTKMFVRTDHLRIIFAFAVCVFLLNGCKSSEKDNPLQAGHSYFEGSFKQNEQITCQFDLQTIYFSGRPIDLYLQLLLQNDAEGDITLDAKNDLLAIYIHNGTKYPIELSENPSYSETLQKKGKLQKRFRIFRDSLLHLVQTNQVASIQLTFNGLTDTCEALPKS